MCKITQCCFCCGLRVGCYLSAAYTMVLGGIGVIIAGVGVGLINVANKELDRQGSREADRASDGLNIIAIILYVTLAIYLLWILTAILLIVGTHKSQRGYLIPWIVMTIIMTVFAGIAIIMGLATIAATFASATSALTFVIQVVLFILNIYALIGVTSFYKDNCMDMEVTGGKQIV